MRTTTGTVSPRWVMGLALCLVGCGASPGTSSAAATATPGDPNIVVILVDDLGWADLSCQGSTFFETPNIDRLAAEGVRFTNAYAACAVCSPSRAALQTGRYPARLGVTDWIRPGFQRGVGPGNPESAVPRTEYLGGAGKPLRTPPNPFWMELDEVTMAEVFGAQGYRTCHVGKWHLGGTRWHPEQQGYDENYGGCDFGQPPSYFDPYANERLEGGIPTLPSRKKGEYLTDREADEAVGFIRRNAERPFLLHFAPYAVHTPIQAKDDLVERYKAKDNDSQQKNATYAAMVHSVDEAVGRIMAALEDEGVADNTLVVFTSDNGGLLGPTHNLGLRSGKGFPYEGGIRVPMIVRWPQKIAAAQVVDDAVCGIDVLPTLCDASAVRLPGPVDGVSLLSALGLPTKKGRLALSQRSLFFHFPHYRYGDEVPYSIARVGSLKLIKRYDDEFVGAGGPSFELFDLEADPGERHGLAAQLPAEVARLDGLLVEHLEDVGGRLPILNAAHQALPKVLILGDSISMGYTPHVRKALFGKARVFRPMTARRRGENCEGTTKGVAEVDRWMAAQGGNWDVIHFNFGLHDIKRVDSGTRKNSNDPMDPRQAELATYLEQLERIVMALKKTGARLVFATTTPFPEGKLQPHRDASDVTRYNRVAVELMMVHGVEVDDLSAVVGERLDELQRKGPDGQPNVHFLPKGQRLLGEHVATAIRDVLAPR